VLLLAAILGFLDGLQSLTLGLVVLVFGVAVLAVVASQTLYHHHNKSKCMKLHIDDRSTLIKKLHTSSDI
jgi:hypothetical protein